MNRQNLLELRNPHSVLAAIRHRPQAVKEIRLTAKNTKGPWEQVIELAASHAIAVSTRGPDGARRQRDRPGRNTERTGAGMALVAPPTAVELKHMLTEPQNGDLLIALDCLQDPQNVGAIFRSTSFFGARGLITTKDKSAPINATVCDIAAGGADNIPFHIATNLSRALEKARDAGYWILGTSEHADTNVFDIDDRPWVVVIGNEQSGMRRLTAEKCDEVCRLEPKGGVTSLNAAAATSSLLTALSRPR